LKQSVDKEIVDQEQIVLGIFIARERAREKLMKFLSTDDFCTKRHRIIFDAVRDLHYKHIDIDIDAIKTHITHPEEDWGGYSYVKNLHDSFKETKNAKLHVDKLKKNAAVLRIKDGYMPKLFEALKQGKGLQDLGDIVNDISIEIANTSGKIPLVTNKEILESYKIEMAERLVGRAFIGTGYPELDALLTDGMAPGKITICAGRPRMGKSSLMDNIIIKKMDSIRQLVIPIEVGVETTMDNMTSIMTGIPIELIAKKPRDMTAEQKVLQEETVHKILSNKNLRFLDHYFNKTPKRIDTNLIAEILESHQFDVVYVDLFDRLADVTQEANIMFKKLQFLQGLFQEKKTHGFLTAQINRTAEQGKDKRPSLSMIKSCGGFEEMADLVLGAHRQNVYDESLEDDILEILILKQKRGPQGTVAYRFNPGILKLEEWVENPNEEMFDINSMFKIQVAGP